MNYNEASADRTESTTPMDILKLGLTGVVINLVFGSVVAALGLPLYLDTVGTILVSILGGYLPGVIVGFATNIIKSVSDPSSLYYGVLNVMIAVAAAFLARFESRPVAFLARMPESVLHELKAVFVKFGVLRVRYERLANGNLAAPLMFRGKCGAVG